MFNQIRAALALAILVGGLGYAAFLMTWERQSLRALAVMLVAVVVAELLRPSELAIKLARRRGDAE